MYPTAALLRMSWDQKRETTSNTDGFKSISSALYEVGEANLPEDGTKEIGWLGPSLPTLCINVSWANMVVFLYLVEAICQVSLMCLFCLCSSSDLFGTSCETFPLGSLPRYHSYLISVRVCLDIEIGGSGNELDTNTKSALYWKWPTIPNLFPGSNIYIQTGCYMQYVMDSDFLGLVIDYAVSLACLRPQVRWTCLM